jgi:hypothetical protein
MARGYRGEDTCIFNDNQRVNAFCAWSDSMMKRLQSMAAEGEISALDRIDVCRLCQEQSTLRSVSFLGTLMKELKETLNK